MTPFEAYHIFNSLRLHFQSESYDYFKYNKKVKTTLAGFEKRKDKFFYQKLSRRKDVQGFVLSNIIDSDYAKWIGGLIQTQEAEHTYFNWLKRQESLTYVFTGELDFLDPEFNSNLLVRGGQHPILLKKVLGGQINYETLLILDNLCNFFPYWMKKIHDDILWPKIYLKCVKYKPFVNFDRDKMKGVVVEKFKSSMAQN